MAWFAGRVACFGERHPHSPPHVSLGQVRVGVAFLGAHVDDVYESFVQSALVSLLTQSPHGLMYRALTPLGQSTLGHTGFHSGSLPRLRFHLAYFFLFLHLGCLLVVSPPPISAWAWRADI